MYEYIHSWITFVVSGEITVTCGLMFICTYINIYISIYIHRYIHIHISKCMKCIHRCTFMYMYTYIHKYQHVHTHIDFIIYTHIEYIYVSIFICICICIYIYSNDTHQKNNILSLVKALEKKKVYFQNVKSMSNLCRSWRRFT